MRTLICTAAVVVFLGMASAPAHAQLRSNSPQQAPVKVLDEGSAFTLNKLFSPEHFQMQHSYSLGYSGFGGMGLTMGEYTNTMLWNFSQKLAARVDVGFAHTPFGTGNASPLFNGKETFGKIYLRNAEIAYQPTKNTSLHFSVRQSPYGSYMNPYGYYGRPYGYDGYGYRGFRGDFGWH